MRVTSLKLANVRAIETAEFRFQPGFNLIVGVNGVGKTSVLDALGVCLSAVVKYANGLKYKVRPFSSNDLRVGTEALTAECEVQLDGAAFTYLVHNPRETSVAREKKAGEPRAQVHDTPARGRVHRRHAISFDGAQGRTPARNAVHDAPRIHICTGTVEPCSGWGNCRGMRRCIRQPESPAWRLCSVDAGAADIGGGTAVRRVRS